MFSIRSSACACWPALGDGKLMLKSELKPFWKSSARSETIELVQFTRATRASFCFPNIIFSQDILVQRSQCTVGGVAVSALPDQSCPKNKDKLIQNQKQTHLSLGETFHWNVWSSRNTTQISAIKLKLFRDPRQRTPFHLDKNTRSKNLHYNLETALYILHSKG